MSDVKVKITGNINKNLDILLRKLKNPAPALKKIGQLEVSQTKLRFRNSKDPDGNDWEPLSPFTIAARRKGRGSGSPKILVDTGRLRSSITFATSNTDVFIGTNVVYGSLHQEGGKVYPFGNKRASKVEVPARPFLGINEKTNENVFSVLKRFLDF